MDNMPKNDISKTKNINTSVRAQRDFEIAKVTKILEFRDLDDKWFCGKKSRFIKDKPKLLGNCSGYQ